MLSAVSPRQSNLASQHSHRILVVDDDEDSADVLAMLLRLLGHEVRATYTGRDALAAVPVFRPSVVVLDIGMPSMDGCETARRIRSTPDGSDVVLIALTGWTWDEDDKRVAEAGFDHQLTKPLDPVALQSILESLAP